MGKHLQTVGQLSRQRESASRRCWGHRYVHFYFCL